MKKPAVSIAVVLTAVLLAVFVLAGYTAREAPAGEALTGTLSEHAFPLFFEPYGATQLFAYTDDTTYVLAADGSRAYRTEYPGQFAFLRGGSVTVASDLQDFIAVQRFDAESLTETDFFALELSGKDVKLLETDGFGRLYAVLYSEPAEILVFDAAGSYTGSLLYADPVNSMQVLGDALFVFFADRLERIALHTGFPQTGTDVFPLSEHGLPSRMLDLETYIDTEGYVRTLDGGALLDTGASPLGAHLTVLRDGEIFWASDSGAVSKMSLSGGVRTTHPVRGSLQAITAAAAVTRYNNVFYYTVYGDFTLEPTPSPGASAAPSSSPSASPSSSPSPPPDAAQIAFSGAYLIAPEGTTSAKLRGALSPRETQVYTETMAVASGKLKTGMVATVDGTPYTVVVPGDVNGTGTVNSADLRLLQRYLAGDEKLEDAACFAADLSRDGIADAVDLVLLAARIAS